MSGCNLRRTYCERRGVDQLILARYLMQKHGKAFFAKQTQHSVVGNEGPRQDCCNFHLCKRLVLQSLFLLKVKAGYETYTDLRVGRVFSFFHPGLVETVKGSVFGFHSYLVKWCRLKMWYRSADIYYFSVTVQ